MSHNHSARCAEYLWPLRSAYVEIRILENMLYVSTPVAPKKTTLLRSHSAFSAGTFSFISLATSSSMRTSPVANGATVAYWFSGILAASNWENTQPISAMPEPTLESVAFILKSCPPYASLHSIRSEERRVGKECVSTCRTRWSRYQ